MTSAEHEDQFLKSGPGRAAYRSVFLASSADEKPGVVIVSMRTVPLCGMLWSISDRLSNESIATAKQFAVLRSPRSTKHANDYY
eukprot:3031824-Pleurochrysis_carterae.AAC.1